jgi:glycosyltransferase involved in cell wall biosynthesis
MTLVALGLALRLKPDVCHFHDLDFAPMVPLMRCFSRARLIYDVHELYPERMLVSEKIPRWSRRFAARMVDLIERIAARECSVIVGAVDSITKRFRAMGSKAVTVFNYPRLSLFAPDSDRVRQLAASFGDRPILLYQGTMGRDRGLSHMLEGMAILRERMPGVLLVLVGMSDPVLREKVDARVRRDGLDECIHIVSWAPHAEIANYIAIADIGLVPLQPSKKNRKSLPLKIFEYMACGLPMLVANLDSTVPYIDESRSGVIYDSTDPEAFAREAEILLKEPKKRAAMSEGGKTAVNRSWRWNEMEHRLLETYRKLEQA